MTKSKGLKGLSTISAFSLSSAADRRTLQRRLLAAGIECQCQVGRARLYRVKDLQEAAVAPADSASGDRASLHAARLRQLVLKNVRLQRQLQDLEEQNIRRYQCRRVFTQFVKALTGRQRAQTKSLVEAVRAERDTAAACEIARRRMLDLWSEMATGAWFKSHASTITGAPTT
jgi:hypothetical protein